MQGRILGIGCLLVMRSAHTLKGATTKLAEKLKIIPLGGLDEIGKKLYVCVSPVLSTGYYGANYYDGYDYAAIGELADKVILMAYDYEAKDMRQFVGTNYYKAVATTPINEVYLGLRAITAQMDASKVLLGFSC